MVSPCLITSPLRFTLKHLSRWLGIIADWCLLAEAGLHVGVEATDSPSHLVNTFRMCINAQYFASVHVDGPFVMSSRITCTCMYIMLVLTTAPSGVVRRFVAK